MSRLSLLVDLASLLAREVDLDSLLATACERMAVALRADRASIWLVDAERGDLVTRVALLPELPELRQPLERGIAGYVARTGKRVRLDDAAKDDRFDPSADRATGYTTRSMLVAPIRDHARRAGPRRDPVAQPPRRCVRRRRRALPRRAGRAARAGAGHDDAAGGRRVRAGRDAARPVQPHRRAQRGDGGGLSSRDACRGDRRHGAPLRRDGNRQGPAWRARCTSTRCARPAPS